MAILKILLLSISALSEVHFLDEFSRRLFLFLWRRGEVEITTSSVSPEIKRSLHEHGDVPDVAK